MEEKAVFCVKFSDSYSKMTFCIKIVEETKPSWYYEGVFDKMPKESCQENRKELRKGRVV